MYQDNIPMPFPHQDPWVELTRPYITHAVLALGASGLAIVNTWLDPSGPRDATIVYSPADAAYRCALVWDEVTGWRHGRFEGGRQGIRTTLSDVAYLGGGVLPSGADLAAGLLAGVSESRREYRSDTDVHDGLDDTLRHEFSRWANAGTVLPVTV